MLSVVVLKQENMFLWGLLWSFDSFSALELTETKRMFMMFIVFPRGQVSYSQVKFPWHDGVSHPHPECHACDHDGVTLALQAVCSLARCHPSMKPTKETPQCHQASAWGDNYPPITAQLSLGFTETRSHFFTSRILLSLRFWGSVPAQTNTSFLN